MSSRAPARCLLALCGALLACATAAPVAVTQRAARSEPEETDATVPTQSAARASPAVSATMTVVKPQACERLATSLPLAPGGELRCHGYPLSVRFPDVGSVSSSWASLEQTAIHLAGGGALAVTFGVNLRGLSGLPVNRDAAEKQARALVGALGLTEQGVVPVAGYALDGTEAVAALDFAGRGKKDVKGRVIAAFAGDWTLAALAFGPPGSPYAPGSATAEAFLASFRLREAEREPFATKLPGGTRIELPAGSFRIGDRDQVRAGALSSSVYYLPGRAAYFLVEELQLSQAECLRDWDTPGALKPQLDAQKDVKFLEPLRFDALKGWYLEGMISPPNGRPRRAAGAMVCGPGHALQVFVGGKADVNAEQRRLAQTLAQSVRFGE